MTVCFHMDDTVSSHADSRVNDKFLSWLNVMCGEFMEVTATRGKAHNHLGMTFGFVGKDLDLDTRSEH